MSIDFDRINQAALAGLRASVSSWIPGGRHEGDEYVVKNPVRADNNAGSFKINTRTGDWDDFGDHGVKGGKADPVSLYAYVNEIKQGEAARILAAENHIEIEPVGTSNKKISKGGNWSPIVPVPKTAPNPPNTIPRKIDKKWQDFKIVKYYTYRTKHGDIAGYTVRIILEDGSKEVLPLTYCRSGDDRAWKMKSFSIPRPIYNLDNLLKYSDAQVLIVEGEKCCDVAREIFGDTEKLVAISWIGGGKGVTTIDWKYLKSRKTISWPDADSQKYPKRHAREDEVMDFVDQPGSSAMIKINNIAQCKQSRLINPPKEYKNGWDIGNASEDGWDKKKILEFIKSNLITFGKLKAKPDAKHNARQPFQCLGYNSYSGNIVYYYLPVGTHKVTALSAAAHTKMNMLSLASVHYYEREYPQKTGADYMDAANDCMRQCERVGIYDPLRCRGRGAWFDNGRAVLHLGNKLIVDGKEIKIDDIKSYYIYEAEIPTENSDRFVFDPLPVAQSSKLVDICDMFSWENKLYGKLFAGWIILAPICGAIEWRPHIWLTGATGTGKSWILDNVVSEVLGRMAFNAPSNSTEAGIRQSLKSDAFPVKCDELETEDNEAFRRVQRIIELARQSSSNKSASIVKGTTGGRAISYCIRSCFLFSSINPKLIQAADESRISILKLEKREDYEDGNTFDELRELVIDTLTEEYCSQLRSRAIKLIPVIRQNVVIFSAVMSKILKSKRHGDQIGTLAAGAYALKYDDVIDPVQAQQWAEAMDWTLEAETKEKTDDVRCLDVILQQVIRTDDGNKQEAIGSLVRKAGAPSKSSADVAEYERVETERGKARDALRKYGITTIKDRNAQTYEVAIAESHTLLSKLLENTPWNNGHKLVLMRSDGAQRKIAVFADKRRSPAISIPYDKIFPHDDEEDVELERF